MSDDIPKAQKRTVDDRDHGYDRMTGWFAGRSRNFHHRKLRSRGGLHTAGNLISLNGSGTTGSHGWVHANPEEATYLGLMIPSWVDDPQDVPVKVADVYGRKSWVRLLDSGRVADLTEQQAAAIMLKLGIWTSGQLF